MKNSNHRSFLDKINRSGFDFMTNRIIDIHSENRNFVTYRQGDSLSICIQRN